MSQRVLPSEWIVSRPARWNAALFLLVALGAFLARDVRFDSDPRQLSDGGAAHRRLAEHQRRFGSDETLVLVVWSRPASAGPDAFIELLERSTRALAALPFVVRADSVTNIPVAHGTAGAWELGPVFGSGAGAASDALEYEARVALLRASAGPGARLISADGRHVAIAVRLRDELAAVERLAEPLETIDALLRTQAADSDLGAQPVLAGVPVARSSGIEAMKRDQLVLVPSIGAVLAALLFWRFRRVHAVVLPLTAVGAATVLTVGFVGALGRDLTMLTAVLPVLLMSIGVADAVHLLARFHEERSAGRPSREAAAVTLRRVGGACLFTSTTTAVGFASLMWTNFGLVRDLGAVAAVGVMLAFLVVVPLVCANLARSRAPAASPNGLRGSRARELVAWLLGPRVARSVVACAAALALLAAFAARGVRVDNFMSGVLPRESAARLANQLVDDELGGVIPIEIGLEGPPGSMWEADTVRRLAALTRRLREEPGIGSIFGTAAWVEELHDRMAGGGPFAPAGATIVAIRAALEDHGALSAARLTTPDGAAARLVASTRDLGAVRFDELGGRIEALVERELDGSGVSGHVTGIGTVTYGSVNRLATDVLVSLAMALFVVIAMVGVTLRSARLAAISALPNLLPLLLPMAVFGITGATLDPAPAIVFAIGMGLVVDDTVHHLVRYREELRRGSGSHMDAVVNATVNVGGAVLNSSVVLIAAFLVISASSFPANRVFGLTGAAIVATALVCDVVLLPALLALFGRPGGPR